MRTPLNLGFLGGALFMVALDGGFWFIAPDPDGTRPEPPFSWYWDLRVQSGCSDAGGRRSETSSAGALS